MARDFVIYTVLTGDHDKLAEPEFDPGVPIYCFTDDPTLKSDHHIFIPLPQLDAHKQLIARYIKLHPHIFFPDYEYSVWIDARVSLTADVGELVETLVDDEHPVAAFEHEFSRSLCQEVHRCIDRAKENPFKLMHQGSRYYREGVSDHNYTHIETTAMIRKHSSPKSQELSALWWEEIKSETRRDQIALAYAKMKAGVEFSILPGFTSGNPYFNWLPRWEGTYKRRNYLKDLVEFIKV